MRNFTNNELQADLTALKYQIITDKIADRLSQQFHFDDFFAPQIAAWKALSVTEQQDFINLLSQDDNSYNMETMTFAEFFTLFAKLHHAPKFTTFNVSMMHELLKQYPVKQLIDPCMGWGQRMLLAVSQGVIYHGFDIRKSATDNNRALAKFAFPKHYPFEIELTTSDGAQGIRNLSPKQTFVTFDDTMMFTCPPYFGDEVYSDEGAENKAHSEFLDWWHQIAKNSYEKGIRYFAFQITPDYGDELQTVTKSAGYHLINVIHNTRKNNNQTHINTKGQVAKRKYGQIYVFEQK